MEQKNFFTNFRTQVQWNPTCIFVYIYINYISTKKERISRIKTAHTQNVLYVYSKYLLCTGKNELSFNNAKRCTYNPYTLFFPRCISIENNSWLHERRKGNDKIKAQYLSYMRQNEQAHFTEFRILCLWQAICFAFIYFEHYTYGAGSEGGERKHQPHSQFNSARACMDEITFALDDATVHRIFFSICAKRTHTCQVCISSPPLFCTLLR